MQVNVVICDFYMFIEKTPGNDLQEFKAAREALGLSLEDVFKRTRISVVYLQAIENNEFHLLPVPVYTKNFIKIYARALGISSEQIIKNYEDYLRSLEEERALPPEEVPEQKPFFTRISARKTYWVIAFVLAVVIVLIWLIAKQYESSSDIVNPAGRITHAVGENKVQNAMPSSNVTVPAVPQTQASPAPALNEMTKQLPAGKQTVSANNENSDVKTFKKQISSPAVENIKAVSGGGETSLLVIRAIEETWMRVKADENPSFQVVLKPGEKLERRAASFDIDIGNAGGIKVQFKGKEIENLGKTGEVVHLQLPSIEKNKN